MNRIACRYATVQFLPYAETGEFANVGIVLACPETGYFDYKLQNRRYARITGFFEELGGSVYLTAVKVMQTELERLKTTIAKLPPTPERADAIRHLMGALTHPREALIRFGPVRPVLTTQPTRQLQELFAHYVDREFATPEYVETTIGRRIQTLLKGLKLPAPFKADRIGDEQIHATFPLVQRVEGELRKVIKPFHLAQDEANAIYAHGDAWLQKVRRLRKRNLLPPDVLFAVAAPPQTAAKRFEAFREICAELEEQDIRLIGKEDEASIVAFAEA